MLHSYGIKIYGLDHLLKMRKLKRKSMKKIIVTTLIINIF